MCIRDRVANGQQICCVVGLIFIVSTIWRENKYPFDIVKLDGRIRSSADLDSAFSRSKTFHTINLLLEQKQLFACNNNMTLNNDT